MTRVTQHAFDLLEGFVSLQATSERSALDPVDVAHSLRIQDSNYNKWLRELVIAGLLLKKLPTSIMDTVRYYVAIDALAALDNELSENEKSSSSDLPAGVTDLTGHRIFATDSDWRPSDPDEGDIVFHHSVPTEMLPASDRMVPLNHNQPEYEEIRSQLSGLYDEFRSANDLPIDSDERERIVAGLAAAKILWQSTQLKIIQIKVGLILAVEDASWALEKIGKAAASALLVDAIKAFVKHVTGIAL